MSQLDVQRFLEEQKKIDPEKWFRVKDIQGGLAEKGKSNGTIKGVAQDLFMLMRYGEIDWRGVGVWKHYKEFRAKKQKKKQK